MVAVSLKKKIFFKQKTAYEMLSGDWSSDVCSSDLTQLRFPARGLFDKSQQPIQESLLQRLSDEFVRRVRIIPEVGREVVQRLRARVSLPVGQRSAERDAVQTSQNPVESLRTDEIREIGRASCRERV